MSNLVLNDDSVTCHDCYDQLDAAEKERPENLIMGSTIWISCCWCDASPSKRKSTEDD